MVAAIRESVHKDISVRVQAFLYLSYINGNKQALLSALSDWPVLRHSARNIQGIPLFKIVES